jgi:hypothetical protein
MKRMPRLDETAAGNDQAGRVACHGPPAAAVLPVTLQCFPTFERLPAAVNWVNVGMA